MFLNKRESFNIGNMNLNNTVEFQKQFNFDLKKDTESEKGDVDTSPNNGNADIQQAHFTIYA